MTRRHPASRLLPFAIALVGVAVLAGRPLPDAGAMSGTWILDKDLSTDIDPWLNLSVEIAADGDGVILKKMWRGSREGGATTDSVRLIPGSAVVSGPMEQWPDNRHLGAYIASDRTKTVAARWEDGGRTLVTEATLTVSIQQGERDLRIYTEYRLSPEGDRLDVLELRSTRPRPTHYVFFRADA